MSAADLTRRDLAAALAASGLTLGAADDARARPADEREVFRGLLALERRSVAIYERLARSDLGGRAGAAAKLFAGQERRHVEALSLALRTMGAFPPPEPPQAQGPGGQRRELIRFAVELEMECIRAYYEAHVTLQTPARLATAAGVIANDAQHLAVLRQLLDREPSPVAFVTGRR